MTTKKDAAMKWVGEMNAIPTSMVRALWTHAGDFEGAEWCEVTMPREGDYVYHYSSGERCEIVDADQGCGEYVIHLNGENTICTQDDFEVEHDTPLPMWGSMWRFGDSVDVDWLEERGGIQAMSKCGFRIYEHDEWGYVFGIDGAGYSFYEEHWIPLYEARGLQWHDEEPTQEKEVEVMKKTMTVLMVEPGKAPYESEIGSSLADMQKVVGGYIQAVYPYEEPVALVCNEEGKLDGLSLNRALRDDSGEVYDIIAGAFFVCGLSESNFDSLPPEEMARFKKLFQEPEIFIRSGDRIEVIKENVPDPPKRKPRNQGDHGAR